MTNPIQKFNSTLHEGISSSDLADVLYNRLKYRYPDIVEKYEYDAIDNAIEDVASFHAGAEELGTSDIGIMLREILKRLDASVQESQIYSGGNNQSGVRWYTPKDNLGENMVMGVSSDASSAGSRVQGESNMSSILKGMAEGKEDKIKKLRQDYADKLRWSKEAHDPAQQRQHRTGAAIIANHLKKQYGVDIGQGVAEGESKVLSDVERIEANIADHMKALKALRPDSPAHNQDYHRKHLARLQKQLSAAKKQGVAEGTEQVYKVIALDKSNALGGKEELTLKANSIEDVFERLAVNDWYPLEINGVEVIAGKRLKQGVAEGLGDYIGRKMGVKVTQGKPNLKNAPRWSTALGQTPAGAWHWLEKDGPVETPDSDRYFPLSGKTEFTGFASKFERQGVAEAAPVNKTPEFTQYVYSKLRKHFSDPAQVEDLFDYAYLEDVSLYAISDAMEENGTSAKQELKERLTWLLQNINNRKYLSVIKPIATEWMKLVAPVLNTQGVAEGFGDTIKRRVKNIKRGLKGWDKDATGPGGEKLGDPKDIVSRNKGYDDDTVKRLHKASSSPIGFPFRQGDFDGADKHSPGGLQKRVLDREMKKRGLAEKEVEEGRFVKGPGGVPLDRRGNPIPPKEVAPKAPRGPAGPRRDSNGLTKDDYSKVWRKIEEVVGNIFPDGDPIDWLAPWLKKSGIQDYHIGEVLDKACKLNGYKDMYEYYDSLKTADYGYDQGQLDEVSNKLLGRYKTAAGKDASAADKKGDFKRGDKRFSGIVKATNKQFANDAKPKESSVMKGIQTENLGTPYPGTYEQETAPIRRKGGQERVLKIAFEGKKNVSR